MLQRAIIFASPRVFPLFLRSRRTATLNQYFSFSVFSASAFYLCSICLICFATGQQKSRNRGQRTVRVMNDDA